MEPEAKKELKEMLGLRGLWPAVDEETGVPQLSRVRNQPGLGYIHVDTFIEKLEEQGLTIDPRTLNITKAKEPTPPPPTPPNKCDACEAECGSVADLENHIKADHNGTMTTAPTTEPATTATKPDPTPPPKEAPPKPTPKLDPICANVPGCGKPQSKCTCTPEFKTVYTKAALGKLSYKELQAIAKETPDVPADKSTKDLIKLLTGKPVL